MRLYVKWKKYVCMCLCGCVCGGDRMNCYANGYNEHIVSERVVIGGLPIRGVRVDYVPSNGLLSAQTFYRFDALNMQHSSFAQYTVK